MSINYELFGIGNLSLPLTLDCFSSAAGIATASLGSWLALRAFYVGNRKPSCSTMDLGPNEGRCGIYRWTSFLCAMRSQGIGRDKTLMFAEPRARLCSPLTVLRVRQNELRGVVPVAPPPRRFGKALMFLQKSVRTIHFFSCFKRCSFSKYFSLIAFRPSFLSGS